MSNTSHPRVLLIDNQHYYHCVASETWEPISQLEYNRLVRHYQQVLTDLAEPWQNRDQWKPTPHFETWEGRGY